MIVPQLVQCLSIMIRWSGTTVASEELTLQCVGKLVSTPFWVSRRTECRYLHHHGQNLAGQMDGTLANRGEAGLTTAPMNGYLDRQMAGHQPCLQPVRRGADFRESGAGAF
mmetsp:Transcript_3780/g.6244  ORF Transcript_3780/g.6244 Transcript_3780/m.6244 type:complete len:111 (+) Transcript_3780:90-422(+)